MCLFLIRLIRATARVCRTIRSGGGHAEEDTSGGSHEVTACSGVEGSGEGGSDGATRSNTADLTLPPVASTPASTLHPTPYALPRTDEGVIMHALYIVLTPLLNIVEDEWHKFFATHFSLREAEDGGTAAQGLEGCLREVLLEWGYGDAPDGEGQGGDIDPPEESLTHEEGEDSSAQSHKIEARSEGRCRKLSGRGTSLLTAALHLHSLLTVSGCCCLMGPPAAGKTTVWRVSNGVTPSLRDAAVPWRECPGVSKRMSLYRRFL